MSSHRITARTLIAISVATVAGLIARELVRARLVAADFSLPFSADLSYLAVPVVLLAVLFPLWRSEKAYLASQFRTSDLNWRIALSAIAIGLLMRLAWWCQLVFGVSFGYYQNADAIPTNVAVFHFDCPEPAVLLVGLLVMSLLVPIIEEVTNRAYYMGALVRCGAAVSITVSALIFMVLHRYAGWPFVFFAGVILGVQYWYTRSLWSSVISHATLNGLIQLDWRCLQGRWNPAPGELPLLSSGIGASVLLVLCVALLIILLRQLAIGAHRAPR
tara:strand:+ start:2044 stop:2865 length:822 start_codon:yes stop_codon:yes gene_type:complete